MAESTPSKDTRSQTHQGDVLAKPAPDIANGVASSVQDFMVQKTCHTALSVK
jgi:hypothetical protein